MKACELAEKLMEHPGLDVVVDIHNEGELIAYVATGIDLGWEPSGVISITTENEPCMA